ncbi:nadp-dependent d-sorbitol-6-phosphate dehydrogenase [Moniliophthora roreri MCA 2997]|uniref:Nadp-dependent d-sorbitol-6-phosphate dehydrogenase n=2 Tax=Moniliophthora roreri TaxID=221103 RepID=V2YDR7_MONRO|nr:nadp-dependent d-sorbitol-6-phosphate dehydrogenase [Moniliophthora roreri MCA 2997]KAI3599987.1 nadp-dependent d-sorbitol-6-phosphate dehydrogenase [Moniliophthora roreri]
MSQPNFTLNDGTQVPWLGFGTGTALYKQDATDFVRVAIETGIRHLDGAQIYANEDSLGDGIKASGVPRSELYIVTKLLEKFEEGETPKSKLVESLKKLGVDYVDLYLIHSPYIARQQGKLKEWWKQMEEIKKEGLAKSIGVSNYSLEDLKETLDGATVVPAVNQIEFHPYVWDTVQPIYDFAKEKGIVLESYGGLVPVTKAPGGPVDPVLDSIAARLSKDSGKTVQPSHVLTKWLLQKGVIVVTTSSKQSRIKETLGVPVLPELTADEIKAIEEAGLKQHTRIFMRHAWGE